MNTFKEEFSLPLHAVNRAWLRKSMTVIIGLICIPIAIFAGATDRIIELWNEVVYAWKGNQESPEWSWDKAKK